MHELFGGSEHEHGVAAGVAVRHQIDRRAVVDALHVSGVGQVFADFQEDGGRVAMGAAGAEGGCALNYFFYD